MCSGASDRFSHWGRCGVLNTLFTRLSSFADAFGIEVAVNERLIYLGLLDDEPLPPLLSALHIIMWKFIVIAMVGVDTEGIDFDETKVWTAALRRLDTRLVAYDEMVRLRALRRIEQGVMQVEVSAFDKAVGPLSGYDDEGRPLDRPQLRAALDAL